MDVVTETMVRAALLDCYDLHLPCNIVDLGLVLDVIVREDPGAPGAGIAGVGLRSSVTIDVMLTQTGEAEEAHLQAQIANRVGGIEGVSQLTVRLRHERTWSPALISSRGRRTLGLAGNPGLVQITAR